MKVRSVLCASLVLAAIGSMTVSTATAFEDDAPKRPIAPEDYGRWERLGGGFFGGAGTLSPDGRWLAYEIRRVDGDGELRVRMLATDEVKTYASASRPSFSSDGAWLAYATGHSVEEREKAQKAKKTLRSGVGLLDLADGEEQTIEDVASFAFSDDGRFLAMRRYGDGGEGGADLVLRDLSNGVDTNFGNVGAYAFNDDGLLLAMEIDAGGKAGNGIQIYDAATQRLRTIESSASSYSNMTWREDSTDLAVLREVEYEKDEDSSYHVLAWRGLDGEAPASFAFEHEHDDAMSGDFRVVNLAGLRWADDGSALFFGIREWEKKPAKLVGEDADEKVDGGKDGGKDGDADKDGGKDGDADKDGDKDKDGHKDGDKDKGTDKGKGKSLRETIEEPSNVEVWHAKDIDIMPRQKLTARGDERESRLAAYHLGEAGHGWFVALGDDVVEDVMLLEGQHRALGLDNTPYEELKRFGPTLYDVYVIDVASGDREKVLERVKYRYGSDPTGRWFVFVRDDAVWTYDMDTGDAVNLTGDLDTPFINQENSSLTDEKPPYGIGGWSEDGSRLLLYDRYDMHLFAPDGSAHERLTDGAEKRIRHRRVVVDREDDEFVPLDGPMLVSLYGDTTKKSGYGRLAPGGRLKRLVWEDRSITSLSKADDADVYTYVEQTFHDSPDIMLRRGLDGKSKEVAATNPFQDEFLWGHAELISYESTEGDELQGALFYPADYEEGKQYPMIVDIYELRSQGLHRYSVPSETSAYNTAVFTAEGYFVYTPDIVYRPQNPGLSAVECVVPAVEAVIELGVVDPDRIGLVGHSWGAYQTAFLVTQTDLFAAGIAGAPLTNMMSMSMSIYWNSGQTDAWIFHESQGRMDQPFWKDVDTYIANSPIFNIDDLDTPLMIAFGTEDGAVDFNQGVEMYNAARLIQKQFVMLVYPGENHGLRREENQVDYHYRILEWFGHYLKGDEAPTWITEGQSWLDRQKEIEEQKKSRRGR